MLKRHCSCKLQCLLVTEIFHKGIYVHNLSIVQQTLVSYESQRMNTNSSARTEHINNCRYDPEQFITVLLFHSKCKSHFVLHCQVCGSSGSVFPLFSYFHLCHGIIVCLC
ncbi:hypothetical protein CEXT_25341 [Caerostris extrusa]|uniref:Uncharacterized protein n=1 Tax=Caerostris extrusa TaxID=172846 RepID=A0AAV4V1X5_CAEEX|nr:hypothetical protein CEXT_25341 [Caerostris extrusa]